jgi:RimJ/RimL family protein N-acetyltransferase
MFKYGDISFRSVEERDLTILYKMRKDEEVNDMLFALYPVSMYGQKKWLEQIQNSTDKKVFMVDTKYNYGSWATIGCVRLTDIDFLNRKIEVGADIYSSFRGHGYSKKIYDGLLQYCFDQMGMNQVYLYCFQDNIRAIKCYTAVGFKQLCLLPEWIWKHGKFQNVVLMSVLKRDYKNIDEQEK